MIDWSVPLQWGVWILAGLGVLFLFIILCMVIDEWRTPKYDRRPDYNFAPDIGDREWGKDESFKYLDNEVRGQMRRQGFDEYGNRRGMLPVYEPTLKGRVDMIEQHLNIKVAVKPAQEATLIVKKVKESKK